MTLSKADKQILFERSKLSVIITPLVNIYDITTYKADWQLDISLQQEAAVIYLPFITSTHKLKLNVEKNFMLGVSN